MEVKDAHTLTQKKDKVFKKLKWAANLNLVFGFMLKDVKNATCRYYHAHENNTLMERPKLAAMRKDLIKTKVVLSNTDVIEACRKNEQRRSEKPTNSQISMFLLLYSEMFLRDVGT